MNSPKISQLWIAHECKKKNRRKMRSYNKFKRTKLDFDWTKNNNQQSCKVFNNALNIYVQLSVSQDLKSIPKKLFSFIKNKRN